MVAVAALQTDVLPSSERENLTAARAGGTRPMHVTNYLEPADSPSNTHAFIHAASDGVVIEGIEGWREMPKYRHARRGGKLAGEAAEAAKVWASDRTIHNNTPTATPYGSYPDATLKTTPKSRASRTPPAGKGCGVSALECVRETMRLALEELGAREFADRAFDSITLLHPLLELWTLLAQAFCYFDRHSKGHSQRRSRFGSAVGLDQ